jgi:hypothetical protein
MSAVETVMVISGAGVIPASIYASSHLVREIGRAVAAVILALRQAR